MVSISFSHFVLGIVVIISLLGLRNCEAYSNKGVKNVGNEAGDAILVPENKEISTGKEIVNAVPAAAEEECRILGGRKLMMGRRQPSKEVKRADGISKANEEASKISGNKIIPTDLQKPTTKSKQTMDGGQCDGSHSNATEATRCSTEGSSDDHGSFQKLESQKLREAATRMVNLMNKDYPGGGGGRHKPPINNHEPLH